MRLLISCSSNIIFITETLIIRLISSSVVQ